jgi:hypothetical protein
MATKKMAATATTRKSNRPAGKGRNHEPLTLSTEISAIDLWKAWRDCSARCSTGLVALRAVGGDIGLVDGARPAASANVLALQMAWGDALAELNDLRGKIATLPATDMVAFAVKLHSALIDSRIGRFGVVTRLETNIATVLEGLMPSLPAAMAAAIKADLPDTARSSPPEGL